MICVSLAEPSLAACKKALRGVPFAEIRLDRCQLKRQEIRDLFSLPARLIATCRPGTLPEEKRREALLEAIDAGAAYVDIEVETRRSTRDEVLRAARKRKCRVIISYHDSEKTPPLPQLARILKRCFERGADIGKIACRVRTEKDVARLLSLYGSGRRVIALGIGKKGIITRVAAPLLGAPFTYAALSPGKETAEGQLDWRTLERLLATITQE